jgi:hypothetical protein
MVDSSILSALFSAVAAAVSALTLWFTRLKGPDIVLVNTLNAKNKVIDMRWERFLEYPTWFGIEPIELVFANNGSRSGVITAIEAVFKPSPEFESVFVDFRLEIGWELETSLAPHLGTPISIREGDNRVITLKCTVDTIDWKYHWTDPEISGPLDDINIRTFVENALEINRQKLAKFLDFLHSGKPFGSLTLYLTCTSRKKWFWMGLKTKELAGPLEVVNSFEENVIKGYESCLENWDDRPSGLERALNEIPGIPDLFAGKLKGTSGLLKQPIKIGAIYNISSLRDSWRNLNKTKEIQKFAMLREKDLMKRLEFVADEMDDFNRKAYAARASGEASRLADLESTRANLKQLVERARASWAEGLKRAAYLDPNIEVMLKGGRGLVSMRARRRLAKKSTILESLLLRKAKLQPQRQQMKLEEEPFC